MEVKKIMQKAVMINNWEEVNFARAMNRVLQQNANRRIEGVYPINQWDLGTTSFLVLFSDPVEGTDKTEQTPN